MKRSSQYLDQFEEEEEDFEAFYSKKNSFKSGSRNGGTSDPEGISLWGSIVLTMNNLVSAVLLFSLACFNLCFFFFPMLCFRFHLHSLTLSSSLRFLLFNFRAVLVCLLSLSSSNKVCIVCVGV